MIEGRLLEQLETSGMRQVFIDLSGAFIAQDVDMSILDRILLGAAYLGCETTLTGMTARVARLLLDAGEGFRTRIHVEPTLQQALQKALQAR
jgi:hypothetical protein